MIESLDIPQSRQDEIAEIVAQALEVAGTPAAALPLALAKAETMTEAGLIGIHFGVILERLVKWADYRETAKWPEA